MADIQLRGGHVTTDPRLDRLPEKDPRNRDHPVTATRPVETHRNVPRSYTWRCDFWLDQGSEGACTGFSRAQDLGARPRVRSVTNEMAQQCYTLAKTLDEFPGENYEGSSVQGAAKAAQQLGWIEEYHWAFSLEDFILGLGWFGPAVVGINWYQGMFNPDGDGFIHKTGNIAGGHAILIVGQKLYLHGDGPFGIDLDQSYVKYHNSWGQDWGVNGEAKQSLRDFDAIRQEQAEVCFSTDKKAA